MVVQAGLDQHRITRIYPMGTMSRMPQATWRKMITPEPYLSAYLETARRAVLQTRSLGLENSSSLLKRISRKRSEQIADLQDAIHVILELLNRWEECDEPELRKFLEAYDRRWAIEENDFSMSKTFNAEIALLKNKGLEAPR